MQLYFMQHGLALSRDEDPERPLSAEGTLGIEAAARAMRCLGLEFDAVLASTKQRAWQTAEIVARGLGYPVKSIQEAAALDPSAQAEDALTFLSKQVQGNSVFVAGHLPLLAAIASALLTGHGGAAICFENGGLCRIDVDTLPTHAGVLRWYLTCDHLQRIAETAPEEATPAARPTATH